MPLIRAALPRAALLALPLLAGCGEFWTANVRESRDFPPNSVLLTNADIRAINRIEGFERSLRPVMENGKEKMTESRFYRRDGSLERVDQVPRREVHYERRQFICAEPSPDVARVVQAALSGGLAGSADLANPVAAGLTAASTVKADIAARIDASRSEAIAQLTRRIATIQLLRDGMYRACEAYANGAIGQEIYTAIVSRYDKIMVTMLLGEMASGNLPGMATAGGTATTGHNTATLVALADKLIEVRKTETAADAKLKAANADVAAKEGDVAKKEAALKDAKESGTASARAALEKAQADRDAAKKNQALDAAAAEKAKGDVAAVEQVLRLASGQAAAASTSAIQGGASSTASAQVAEILYRMQREYLNDPQIGTQILICAAEAAQPDALRGFQREFCTRIMKAAFPEAGGTDRALTIQLAELRNQGIGRIMATLPANPTPQQRSEALRAARDLFPPPPAPPAPRR